MNKNQPPKVFVCCKPCRERSCGATCNHKKLDGCESRERAPAVSMPHKGCTCVWAEKVAGTGPNPKLVTG
jgi:hypothetical protein